VETILNRLMKASTTVYLATQPDVADDLSRIMHEAAIEIVRLQKIEAAYEAAESAAEDHRFD